MTKVFLRKGPNNVQFLVQQLNLDSSHLQQKEIWEALWLKYVQRNLMHNVEFIHRVAIRNNSASQVASQIRSVGKQLDNPDSPTQQVSLQILKRLSPKNIYLRAIEDLNQTLINLSMSTEYATDLIISLSIKYSIPKTQLMNLIENQEKSNFFKVELIPQNKQNSREWKHEHLKSKCPAHLLKKAIPFLSRPTLRALLLLSHSLGHSLKKYVFREVFTRAQEMSLSQRMVLWDLVLMPVHLP